MKKAPEMPISTENTPAKRTINFLSTMRSRFFYLLAGALGLSALAYLHHRMNVEQCEDAIGKSKSEIASREQEVMKHLVRVPGGLDILGPQNLSHLEVRDPPPNEAECARLRQKLMATSRNHARRMVRLCDSSALEDLDDTNDSMINLENDFLIACPGNFHR